MIKILHTSDWHAGKTINGIQRQYDLIYALEQIKQILIDEKVDYLIVSGDIFDKPNPSPSDQEIIWSFFLEINERFKIPSILISGNHDSQDFLKSVRKLLNLVNVYVLDRAVGENAIKERMIKVFEKNGTKIFFVLVPYVQHRVFADIYKSQSDIDIKKDYSSKLSSYLQVVSRKTEELISAEDGFRKIPILVSHIMIRGAKVGGTEREISIQDEFSIEPQRIPGIFKYCAFGHIHRYQVIPDIPLVAVYCGTPYQIDFGEEGQEKGVVLVTIGDNMEVQHSFIEFSLKHPLKTYEFEIEKHSLDHIIRTLKEDKNSLKRIVINYPEDKNHIFLGTIRDKIQDNIENVAYIDMKLKDKSKKGFISKLISEEFEKVLKGGEEGNNLIGFYRMFFLDFKKRKEDDWNKVLPKIKGIMEKSEKA